MLCRSASAPPNLVHRTPHALRALVQHVCVDHRGLDISERRSSWARPSRPVDGHCGRGWSDRPSWHTCVPLVACRAGRGGPGGAVRRWVARRPVRVALSSADRNRRVAWSGLNSRKRLSRRILTGPGTTVNAIHTKEGDRLQALGPRSERELRIPAPIAYSL